MRRYTPAMTRKATAGIVAAVIMFAMLFTVGTSYFIFVNSENFLYTQNLVNRASSLQSVINENLVVTAALTNNHIGFYVNNTGGINANITAVFVLDSTGAVLRCDGRGLPTPTCSNSTPTLPVAVNAGKGSPATGYIDTGYTYVSGTDTVKVVTQRGATFLATYPVTPSGLVANALTSGAVGDLYLSFSSYKYYSIAACGPNQCLTAVGPAFAVPSSATSSSIAFSVRVTNLNSQQKNIVLDQYSLLMQFVPPTPGSGGGTARGYAWYIIANSSSTITSTYSPITLAYNQPKTLVFASSAAGSFTAYAPAISANTITLVFLFSHGCEAAGITTCPPASYNYAQNMPYEGTLYT